MAKRQLRTLNQLIALPEFTPTGEQQAVVDHIYSGENLVVKAYAGTGKTATAVESAKRSRRRGRMVVFNNAAKRDAKNRMPDHINVTTAHGMAHDAIIKSSAAFAHKLQWVLDRPKQVIPLSTIATHLKLPNLPAHHCTYYQLAMAVNATLGQYLISQDKEIHTDHVPDETIPITLRLDDQAWPRMELKNTIVEFTQRLWRDMRSEFTKFPITHDGYLKLLHLREAELSESDHIWLLDEYQDTNPVVDAIISAQPGQKVYIGDPYQQIYSWRGAVNAMADKIHAGIPVLPLSRSFRFNHQVAGAANLLLSGLGETTPLEGEPYNLTQMNLHLPHTVLVRTNLSMIALAHEYTSHNQSVYVPGKLPRETCLKVESALALYENRLSDVKVGALRQLGSWGAFNDAAKTLGKEKPEYQILKMLVERYHRTLPNLVALCRLPFESLPNPGRYVTLITAHRAKGREWGYVRLADDLALPENIMEKLRNRAALTHREREAVNVLYVALTRCRKSLTLPPRIRENLNTLNEYFGGGKNLELQMQKPQMDEETIRKRTAKFIATYGKQKAITE